MEPRLKLSVLLPSKTSTGKLNLSNASRRSFKSRKVTSPKEEKKVNDFKIEPPLLL